MIKKFEFKIFLIIFALLLFILSVVIIYTAYNSYNSTIKGITSYIERLYDDKKNPERENIEGLYAIKVSSNKIIDNGVYTDEIKEFTQKILKSNSPSGIIGNYIYSYKNRLGMDRKRRNSIIIRK